MVRCAYAWSVRRLLAGCAPGKGRCDYSIVRTHDIRAERWVALEIGPRECDECADSGGGQRTAVCDRAVAQEGASEVSSLSDARCVGCGNRAERGAARSRTPPMPLIESSARIHRREHRRSGDRQFDGRNERRWARERADRTGVSRSCDERQLARRNRRTLAIDARADVRDVHVRTKRSDVWRRAEPNAATRCALLNRARRARRRDRDRRRDRTQPRRERTTRWSHALGRIVRTARGDDARNEHHRRYADGARQCVDHALAAHASTQQTAVNCARTASALRARDTMRADFAGPAEHELRQMSPDDATDGDQNSECPVSRSGASVDGGDGQRLGRDEPSGHGAVRTSRAGGHALARR